MFGGASRVMVGVDLFGLVTAVAALVYVWQIERGLVGTSMPSVWRLTTWALVALAAAFLFSALPYVVSGYAVALEFAHHLVMIVAVVLLTEAIRRFLRKTEEL